jgi:hypothetical protein
MAARVISLLSARELLHALLVGGGAAGAALVGLASVTNSSAQAQASPAQAQAAPRAAKHAPPPPRAWDANWDRRGERRASDVTRTLILVRCEQRSAVQRTCCSAGQRSAAQRTRLRLHAPDAQHTSAAATGNTPTSRRRRRTRSTS